MFSVDNFYTIFNSHYGRPEKNNLLYLFDPHGSKNWSDITAWGIPIISAECQSHYVHQILNRGAFLMHDQEPFCFDEVTSFKQKIQDVQYLNLCKQTHPQFTQMYQSFHDQAPYINDIAFAHINIPTTKVPIICHSELHSKDIKKLTDNHWVECYYWWHGMVARDWYRHWERHNNLSVYNKANCDYRFLIYSRDFAGTRQYRTKVIDHLRKHQTQVNYNWDNNDRCSTLSATIDVADANNSAIHLVTETLFNTEKIYLTEKVFKPMVMSQPFILFGPPGSLQYLRNYGFKTFNHIWPEEYDYIHNASERKKIILDLVDSLATMSNAQFKQLYQELLPILEHNRKHFFSSEFQDTLWNELQKNCSEALLKQQDLSEQLPGGAYLYYINKFAKDNLYITDFWRNNIIELIKNRYIDHEQIKKIYPNLSKLI